MSLIAEKAKFVGRINEITELAEIMESGARGNCQTVFINGEAGIGKTRFINEVQNLPIGQRFTWLIARCIYLEGTDPYLPFSDALRGWLEPLPTIKAKSTPSPPKQQLPKVYNIEDLERIPILGMKLTEEPEMSFGSFIVKEPKSEISLSIFSTLIAQGRKGLCITRIPPDKLDNSIKNDNVRTFWLSSKPGESCIPPSLTKLSHEILQYIRFHPNSVIILDGLEYIISNLEFNKVLRFVNELVDSMALHKCILFIPINPLTIDPKQLALLERNMNSIDLTTVQEQLGAIAWETNIDTQKNQKFNEEHLQQGRDIIFETTTQKIINIAMTKPVALFIDDLHWADEGALHLLHYVARAVQNHPVVLIGAYRPEDLIDDTKQHPLQLLLDRLIPEKLVNLIPLARLNRIETRGIVDSLLHNKSFPEDLVDFIYSETEGNPFFIEELLRTLEEGGAIKFNEKENLWYLTKNLQEIVLPDTVKEIVHARTNKLSENNRLVLEVASVLGVEFEYNTLEAISKLDEDKLVIIIDELIRFKLLKELPTTFGKPISYRFVHNNICEVLYNDLGESRKRLLHSKTAAVLEEKYKENPKKFIYELTQHYYYGGDYEKALKYSQLAGEKALRDFAPEKAKTFFKWALDSVELMESQQGKTASNKNLHAEILLKLSKTSSFVGEYEESLKYTDELLKLSEKLSDPNKQAEAYINTGIIYSNRSLWPVAIEQFNHGLEISNKSKYDRGMLEANFGLGIVYERMGKYKQARNYFQHFTKLAVTMDSESEIARGYKATAKSSYDIGEYSTSIEYYKKCIELLKKTNNYSELAFTYSNMGVAYFELDEFDKVIECHEKCIELSTKIGDIRSLGYGYSNAAEVYANKQELDKALDYVNKASEIFTKLDEKFMIGLVWMNYGIIYRYKRDWDSSRYYFNKSLELMKNINVPVYQADCTRQLGLMLADKGTAESIKESKKYLTESRKLYKEVGVKRYVDIIGKELDQIQS
jgi:predicted ATPase